MTNNTSAEPAAPSTAPPKKPQWPAHNAPRVWFLTDGLSPIAISLSRHLLEHGDYVVAGILPTEFNSTRGDELRDFMGEIAREGSGAARVEEIDVDDEDGGEDASDDEAGSGERPTNGRRKKNGKNNVRKRWRERFKLVGVDGR